MQFIQMVESHRKCTKFICKIQLTYILNFDFVDAQHMTRFQIPVHWLPTLRTRPVVRCPTATHPEPQEQSTAMVT